MMFDVCCVPWIFCKSRQKKQIGKEGDGDFLEDRMDGGSPPPEGALGGGFNLPSDRRGWGGR